MSNLSIDISSAIKSGTKKWRAAKRQADKDGNLHQHHYRQFYQYSNRVTVKEVAFDVMEAAYNMASSNGKYYANARQIMYAARPEILKQTGRQEVSLHGKTTYFTQTLLKDYIEENNPPWKIAWDARGHITEPHTNKMIGLGGIEVEQYIHDWHSDIRHEDTIVNALVDTKGPQNRYKNALFIEKEGFYEILTDAGFPEIYDMALLSTKGMPVKAACDLIYQLNRNNVRVFVLHDFDYSGFKIVKTLRDGVRLSRGSDVIDLGLRLKDVEGLPTEPVYYKQSNYPGDYLAECGCTQEEIDFLVIRKGYSYGGKRVEINAMTSEQLVKWLFMKFEEHEVKKYIPDSDTLIKGYQHTKKMIHIKEYVEMAERIWAKSIKKNGEYKAPSNLIDRIEEKLEEHQQMSWDQALWDVIEDE